MHWLFTLIYLKFWLLVWLLCRNEDIVTMQKRIYQPYKQMAGAPKKKDKYTFKDIMVIVFAWLMALGLVYIVYLKIQMLHHH